MAEQTQSGSGVNDPSKSSEKPSGSVDERGVSWENRAKEFERKFAESQKKNEDLAKAVQSLETKMVELVEKTSPPEPQNKQELTRQERLQNLASDPDSFVDRKIHEALYKIELERAAGWLRSQEGYKSEYDAGIGETVKKYGLSGTPKQNAETAWRLFKLDNPDMFPALRSTQTDNRDQDIRKYQVSGPGRPGPIEHSDKRKELLKQLVSTKNPYEKARIMGEIQDEEFRRQGVIK